MLRGTITSDKETLAPTAAVDVTTDHRDHVSPIVLDISGESGDLLIPRNQKNVESRQDEVVSLGRNRAWKNNEMIPV